MFLYNAFAAAMLDSSQSTFLWQGTPVFEKGRLMLTDVRDMIRSEQTDGDS